MCAVLSPSRHINNDHASYAGSSHVSVWRYSETGHAGFYRGSLRGLFPYSGQPEPWRKNQALYSKENECHFRGSFPAIQAVTGRRAREISLLMKIFRGKACRYFFLLTLCFIWFCLKKETTRQAVILPFLWVFVSYLIFEV